MADPFGISFAPTGDGAQPNGGARPSPIQQAIQTLSFKIPRVAGASAFTAQPLLTAQGGDALGGNPNSAAILEQIRRMLFGGQGGQQPGGGGTPSSPAPSNFSALFGMPGPSPAGGAPFAPSSVPLPRFDPTTTPPRSPDPSPTYSPTPEPAPASPMPAAQPPVPMDTFDNSAYNQGERDRYI